MEGFGDSSIWSVAGIPRGGVSLLNEVERGFKHGTVKRVAEYSGVSQQLLIESLGLNRSTYSRRAKAGRLNQDESDKLYRFTEVLSNTIELFEGDKVAAKNWLQSPVKGLGERAPIDMIKTQSGSEMVLQLIERLEEGVFS
ncbi:antitoxin Xre-like helix-turn-helix domain-containing protein [Thiomicrorhabdus indica]|uniref:type II RES/Xre toxin-antitoxin system antitoxin n=1 Tax=Thiomicrorhabdus indica TaxID=2267253 RepID=UPI0013EE5889|nr:antitoxin Xre-like helix-turn-helix domain-containing protein [Thiomicrorhabdus indica]